MEKLRLAAVLFAVSSFLASGNTFADDQSQQMSKAPERLDITFDYQRGGIASSQYAIWVEDAAGKPVRTIFMTRFTATRGFSERPDAVPTWVARFNPAQMTSAQVDAVSGATPSNGSLHYAWDGKDNQGKPVPAGSYTVFLEGTLYWGTRVLYSAEGPVGQRHCRSGSRDGAQNRYERSQPEHDYQRQVLAHDDQAVTCVTTNKIGRQAAVWRLPTDHRS